MTVMDLVTLIRCKKAVERTMMISMDLCNDRKNRLCFCVLVYVLRGISVLTYVVIEILVIDVDWCVVACVVCALDKR